MAKVALGVTFDMGVALDIVDFNSKANKAEEFMVEPLKNLNLKATVKFSLSQSSFTTK